MDTFTEISLVRDTNMRYVSYYCYFWRTVCSLAFVPSGLTWPGWVRLHRCVYLKVFSMHSNTFWWQVVSGAGLEHMASQWVHELCSCSGNSYSNLNVSLSLFASFLICFGMGNEDTKIWNWKCLLCWSEQSVAFKRISSQSFCVCCNKSSKQMVVLFWHFSGSIGTVLNGAHVLLLIIWGNHFHISRWKKAFSE